MTDQANQTTKKALIVATVASHIKQFCMNDAEILIGLGYSVEIAANFCVGNAIDDASLQAFKGQLGDKGIIYHQVPFARGLTDSRNHREALKTLRELFEQNHYSLVHCHTPIAGALCRFAAKKYRKQGLKVLYTAHGFHFYKGAPLKNWLCFYPVEKICSRWTDVLITINKEDYALAQKKMCAKTIEYVSGVGIDLAKFYPNKYGEDIINAQKQAFGLSSNDIMLLSVGELTPRKNHKIVIQALAELADPQIKYFICGCGQLEGELKKLISYLGLTANVFLLGYRKDVDLLYACADLFVFPSLQEGMPVALLEALASGLPAIGSDIRGNNELLEKIYRFPTNDTSMIAQLIHSFKDDGFPQSKGLMDKNMLSYGKHAYIKKVRMIYNDIIPNA